MIHHLDHILSHPDLRVIILLHVALNHPLEQGDLPQMVEDIDIIVMITAASGASANHTIQELAVTPPPNRNHPLALLDVFLLEIQHQVVPAAIQRRLLDLQDIKQTGSRDHRQYLSVPAANLTVGYHLNLRQKIPI
jgi:hypothetical protein